MSTQKNKAARAAETKEEKRTRLADPALNSAEEQRAVQESNPTLQQNLTAARRQYAENLVLQFQGALADLRRQKLAASRGNFQAAARGYDRVFQRIQALADDIECSTGERPLTPVYSPPIDDMEFVMEKRPAATSSYRETAGKGVGGKGIGIPIPGSAADNGWLESQRGDKK